MQRITSILKRYWVKERVIMGKCRNKNTQKKIMAIILSAAVVGVTGAANVSAADFCLSDILQGNAEISDSGRLKTIFQVEMNVSGDAVGTVEPSIAPTESPVPSVAPTESPVPSIAPTESPSFSEAPLDTEVPVPSAGPQITESPSAGPEESSGPVRPGTPPPTYTARPTKVPFPSAGVLPTEYPTGAPSATDEPSYTMGPVVSASPTVRPTVVPSETAPSGLPVASKDPIVLPTVKPPVVTKTPPPTGATGSETPKPTVAPTMAPAPDYTMKPSHEPMGEPSGSAPGGNYMPGDSQFLPGIFKDFDKNNGSGGSTSDGNNYWGNYNTTQQDNEQVVLPGGLSNILGVEKETTLKESEKVRWGDARQKDVTKLSKPQKAQETIPETNDRTQTEWVLPVFAGSVALITAFRRKKQEKVE